MALLENRIEAFNAESSVHSLSDEASAAIDDAVVEHGRRSADSDLSSKVTEESLNEAADEIAVVRQGIELLRTPPSPRLLDHIRKLEPPSVKQAES